MDRDSIIEKFKSVLSWLKTAGMFVWALITTFPIPAAVILVVVIVACVITQKCGSSESELEKRADESSEVAIEKQTEANVKSEQITNSQKELQTAEKNTNAAVKEKEKSNKKDSSEFDSQISEDRYCSRWPDDSSCAEWRKRNGY